MQIKMKKIENLSTINIRFVRVQSKLTRRLLMLRKLILGGVLGGIILFIWSALSWMVLPWHMKTLQSFKDDNAVSQILTANSTQSGMYMLPSPQMKTSQATPSQGPVMFAAVRLEGMPSMVREMIIQFIIQIVAAFLVTWLVMKTAGLSYLGRVGFVIVFALTAGIVTDLPYWNWFSFDTSYTLVALADLMVGWFLAGLVIAKIARV